MSTQALYPWRRVFKALFAHDHFHSQEHTALEYDSTGELRAATKLGIRLHECGCGWQEWHNSLSVLLEVLEDEMPVLPILPQDSRAYTGVSCLACSLNCSNFYQRAKQSLPPFQARSREQLHRLCSTLPGLCLK